MNIDSFCELLCRQSQLLHRSMPWRDDTRPYFVLVSELMLQQTQVERVVPKFQAFIDAFPNEVALAQASLGDVLQLWQGLGYNRRAKFLHDAAIMIKTHFNGIIPQTEQELVLLPGVGKNTAGAIRAYSYNQPALFVETNIRTVYFHHFFHNNSTVSDKEIIQLLEKTIDLQHPREFYWALMDYGSWLKRQGVHNIQRSSHYKKQSPLAGSVREVRGQIVKSLARSDESLEALKRRIDDDLRFELALTGLLRDGLITQTGCMIHLTK